LAKTRERVWGRRRSSGRFFTGTFVQSTAFAEVDHCSRLAQEEIFGPVLAAIPPDTEEGLVRMANEVDYGLVAGLWRSDVARRTCRPAHWMLHCGGYRMSGVGRANGLEALHEFTEVVVELSAAPPADPFRD
jgi:(Z)-2-((N-methylformamido)methylene)-5-hydroxybutyrolactone dehydrogenase